MTPATATRPVRVVSTPTKASRAIEAIRNMSNDELQARIAKRLGTPTADQVAEQATERSERAARSAERLRAL